MNRIQKNAILLALCLGTAFSGTARADWNLGLGGKGGVYNTFTCEGQLRDLFRGGIAVPFQLVTVQSNNGWSMYAHGQLSFDGNHLVGSGTSLFSDRKEWSPNQQRVGFASPNQIFAVDQPDTIALTLDKDGSVRVTYTSWGGGSLTVNGTCSQGMVYGVLGDQVVAISLSSYDLPR